MVDLFCRPFIELIDRMRLEYPHQGSIFDLPARKWYLPSAGPDAPNLTVRFHEQLAGNPVGPASGPQTQMAQNLVLSWLAGSRIMELKTVQVDDRLNISRPCIDATNVGYNVEWSQELLLHDSLDQYVQGAMLIHMLRHAPDAFGHPFGDIELAGVEGETIYDMSIGYDLAGIRSDKVRRFMEGMIDATESVERLRSLIPRRLNRLRDLDYPTALSRSITLSTFHGCPADEIERICEFLLTDIHVDVIVKMNPPMLGKERLEHLLHGVMGYTEVAVNNSAYSIGLQFDESIEMTRRLTDVAQSHGLHFGAKFSNTLEVVNHRDFFIPEEKIMYLSGPPLHVITLTLADEYRKAVGPEVPISFSAGIDRKNFVNMVACGFTPITTCTDLLKTGGYGRLPPYLEELQKAMVTIGANTVDEFVLDSRQQRSTAADDPIVAGFLNTQQIVAETQRDERYYQAKNSLVPRRINSHLDLFDCITCDKCIPVCPNDANFYYQTEPLEFIYHDVSILPDGEIVEDGPEKTFRVERKEQIANFADFCNYCGNCDTFCPEYDGPYLKKPNFFGSREAFEAGSPHDGLFLEGRPGSLRLIGRMKGHTLELEQLSGNDEYKFRDGLVVLHVVPNQSVTLDSSCLAPNIAHTVEMGNFYTMVTLLKGITNDTRIHPINTPLICANES